MELNEYQEMTGRTARYPKTGQLQYITIALCGEAGEFANEVKKMMRDDKGKLTKKRRKLLQEELGDTFWYLARTAKALDLSLEDLAKSNIRKLKRRYKKYNVSTK